MRGRSQSVLETLPDTDASIIDDALALQQFFASSRITLTDPLEVLNRVALLQYTLSLHDADPSLIQQWVRNRPRRAPSIKECPTTRSFVSSYCTFTGMADLSKTCTYPLRFWTPTGA